MSLVENEIFIPAAPEEVWRVLVDAERYREWNPRLRHIEGALQRGGVVTLHYARTQPWLPTRFVVDVDACEPARELRWSGPTNASRHLLRASHWFALSPQGDGTHLVHAERFQGPLVALVWCALGPIVRANHADVNAAISARCLEQANANKHPR